MYEVKPTCVNFEINIPNCMYEVKVIQNLNAELPKLKNKTNNNCSVTNNHISSSSSALNSFDILDSKIKILSNQSDMEKLEARQEILLDQLHKFKARLLEIRKKLKLNESAIEKKCTNKANNKLYKPLETKFQKKSIDLFDPTLNQASIDIVINAHPKYVPYGLLGVKNAWKNIVKFSFKCFSHSSLNDISPEAKHFQKQLTTEDGFNQDKNIPVINVSLIWKNCEHTEMISAPTLYKPIYGEINILRFLSRIGPLNYRYDFQPDANQVDIVLDLCYQLLRRTGNAQQELITYLSECLGKQKYFGGDQLSIADIAVSSSLKRIPQTVLKNLPESMKKWFNNAKTSLY